jgi:hypothetical protein
MQYCYLSGEPSDVWVHALIYFGVATRVKMGGKTSDFKKHPAFNIGVCVHSKENACHSEAICT